VGRFHVCVGARNVQAWAISSTLKDLTDNRAAMRTVAALLASLALLSTGCGPTSPDASAPRYGGYGTTVPLGLEIVDAKCLYADTQVVASGTIRQTGPAEGLGLRVTAYIPVLGSAHFERTADYPAPATTGTDVPFRIAVQTGDQPGLACDMLVSWTG